MIFENPIYQEISPGNVLEIDWGYVHDFQQQSLKQKAIDGYRTAGARLTDYKPRFWDKSRLVVIKKGRNGEPPCVGIDVVLVAPSFSPSLGVNYYISNETLAFKYLRKVAESV